MKESIKIAGGFDLADLFPSITWLHYFTRLRLKLERVHGQIDQIMENIINEHKEAKSITKHDHGPYGGLYVMRKIILGLILMCALGLILCWAGPDHGESDEDLVDVLIKYEDGTNKEFFLTRDNIKAIILVSTISSYK